MAIAAFIITLVITSLLLTLNWQSTDFSPATIPKTKLNISEPPVKLPTSTIHPLTTQTERPPPTSPTKNSKLEPTLVCKDLWYSLLDQTCIRIFPGKANFRQSVQLCTDQNAELFLPQNLDQHDSIFNLPVNKNVTYVIGIMSHQLGWMSLRGKILDFTMWSQKDHDFNQKKKCAKSTNLGWTPIFCHTFETNSVVCQY